MFAGGLTAIKRAVIRMDHGAQALKQIGAFVGWNTLPNPGNASDVTAREGRHPACGTLSLMSKCGSATLFIPLGGRTTYVVGLGALSTHAQVVDDGVHPRGRPGHALHCVSLMPRMNRATQRHRCAVDSDMDLLGLSQRLARQRLLDLA